MAQQFWRFARRPARRRLFQRPTKTYNPAVDEATVDSISVWLGPPGRRGHRAPFLVDLRRSIPSMALHPEIKTLGDVPRFHARTHGEDVALIFGDRTTTYREWYGRCTRVARGLIDAGVRRGSRIGFIGKNSDAYFEVLFGGAMAGAVLVPVNWRLAPAEIGYIVDDAGIEVLFVDVDHAKLIEGHEARLHTVRKVIAWGGAHARWPSFEDWLGTASDDLEIGGDPRIRCCRSTERRRVT
jgi:hypothetical protein